MQKLTWRQAIAWHLRRQYLDARLPRAKFLKVVSGLCGLHAQVMSSADLTAWCRVEGLRADDVSRALWKDRKLVKTWAMRGTLHLLPADEYGMWLQVLALYDARRTVKWLEYFGVTEEELNRLTAAAAEASRERILTRDELADEIARITGLTAVRDKLRMGWGTLLKPACYRGHLCFGPNKGQRVTFMNPGLNPALNESSRSAVVGKYFATYGPANLREFARWLNVGSARALEMTKDLGEELAEVDVEGTSAFMLKKDVKNAAQAEPVRTVRLLPAFDQYVFAAGLHSAQVLPGDFRSRIYRTQAWFSPVLLVDGRMDGVWHFDRKGRRLALTIEPFIEPTARVKRAAGEEAERMAAFMERKLELIWT